MKKRRIGGRLLAAAWAALWLAVPAYAKDRTIPEGVFVGETGLGGMTEEEAAQAVQAQVDKLAENRIILDIDGNRVTVAAGDLGLAWANPEAVTETVRGLSAGNLVRQYMIRKDLEKEPVRIPLETAVEGEKLEAFLTEQQGQFLTGPQNASVSRVGGAFQVTPGVVGRVTDADATRERIEQALNESGGGDIAVAAVVVEKAPDITEQQLSTIQDVLGTFTTDFSSSGSARSGNLANGASKINGLVLMPGQTMSGYECMHPFTKANGYHTASAYENGRVVDSVGGGVCQIATTLYNAALRAELGIAQRQNHSMLVTYVEPSMDAAIAGTVKDIKITNNYSTPIYIEGYTSGKKLTFTIYGKETRPADRKVEYVSEILSTVDPGSPSRQLDGSLAPGTSRQVQSAHRGMKSRLWKVVTVDGVETERTLLHTDTYHASKAIVLVGPEPGSAASARPVGNRISEPDQNR